MSMPALLSHFGINTARFVTSTGEVVFDGVTSNGGDAFTHVTHGAVTPVAKHTFHGGAEEPDDGENGPAVWWDNPDRLNRHIDAMRRSFPHFAYLAPEDGSAPCWGGVIDTGRGKFDVGILIRRDEGLPSIVVFNRRLGATAGGRWQRAPHLYDNDNLCVAGRDDWDPDEHTVATATAWAAHWLAAYTEWRISRKWPVEGVRTVAA
ncbi:hypothetical protein EV652_116157 [Kribbella steppae]|uniref:Type II CBASS E2 protein domain-containing protein n=1 Tax=Kribbella steppae TaxID=2512223 RepID=A0A4V2RY75_9ACTN|nr:hypothetical protein [Kribbella steppae]TCO18129.1 hypothetical protein EV652_116157 [Kribbella steppae]